MSAHLSRPVHYRLRAPRLNLIPNGVSPGSKGVLSLHPCPPLLPCFKCLPQKGLGCIWLRLLGETGTGVPSTRGGDGPRVGPLSLISRADHSSWTLALLTCILLHHHGKHPDVPPSSFFFWRGPRKCPKAGNYRCTLHWRTAGHLARPACYLYKEYPPRRGQHVVASPFVILVQFAFLYFPWVPLVSVRCCVFSCNSFRVDTFSWLLQHRLRFDDRISSPTHPPKSKTLSHPPLFPRCGQQQYSSRHCVPPPASPHRPTPNSTSTPPPPAPATTCPTTSTHWRARWPPTGKCPTRPSVISTTPCCQQFVRPR